MEYTEDEYSDGALRPLRQFALRPSEHLRLFMVRGADPHRWDLDRLAKANAEDMELAVTGLDDWADALDREEQG